jgi:hypothetical protein
VILQAKEEVSPMVLNVVMRSPPGWVAVLASDG